MLDRINELSDWAIALLQDWGVWEDLADIVLYANHPLEVEYCLQEMGYREF